MSWVREIGELRGSLLADASEEELAFLLGVSERELSCLSDESVEPPIKTRRRLACVTAATRSLRRVGETQRESFLWWVTGPREDAAGLTPLEWIRRGGHPELAVELAARDTGAGSARVS